MSTVTGKDIQDMVGHWVNTPMNAYFGLDYGQSLKDILQQAMNDGGASADEQLDKLKTDVPITQTSSQGTINLYAVDGGIDNLKLFIEVAGGVFPVGN